MKHRIKKLIGLALLFVMGIGITAYAQNTSPPSVTVTIPMRFASDLSDAVDVTVTIRDRASTEVIKTLTRSEIQQAGEIYSFPLSYTQPGSFNYSITATSKLGVETCYADVAVLSDEDGALNATLVLYWKDATAKLDEIEFGSGHAEKPTPENPTPENPTLENPTPENPTPENPTPENPTPSNPTPSNPTPSNPTPSTPTRPSTSQILGLTSHSWYFPLLFMAAGIVVAFAAVCYKKAHGRSEQ